MKQTKMKAMDICDLRRQLHYDERTGTLYRLLSRGKVRAGDVAGSVPKKSKYSYLWLNGEMWLTHRVVWAYVYGVWPSKQIDHINGNRLDNRIENLRLADQCEQNQNVAKPRSNTSGHIGVTFDKTSGKWQAQIRANGRYYMLGRRTDILEAAQLYLDAKRRLHTFNPEPRE